MDGNEISNVATNLAIVVRILAMARGFPIQPYGPDLTFPGSARNNLQGRILIDMGMAYDCDRIVSAEKAKGE